MFENKLFCVLCLRGICACPHKHLGGMTRRVPPPKTKNVCEGPFRCLPPPHPKCLRRAPLYLYLNFCSGFGASGASGAFPASCLLASCPLGFGLRSFRSFRSKFWSFRSFSGCVRCAGIERCCSIGSSLVDHTLSGGSSS